MGLIEVIIWIGTALLVVVVLVLLAIALLMVIVATGKTD